GKGWDFPGCRAAIHDVDAAGRVAIGELMIAAARCAADPAALKPKALAWDRFWVDAPQHARTQRPSDPSWPVCPMPGHPRVAPGASCPRCLAEATSEQIAMPDDATRPPLFAVQDACHGADLVRQAMTQAGIHPARRDPAPSVPTPPSAPGPNAPVMPVMPASTPTAQEDAA
ncbi:MAG: hypothetical protein FWF28_00880, partial [Micrococcales bacterium]|nr:hypothetical protein [Micrococcales bacterium]